MTMEQQVSSSLQEKVVRLRQAYLARLPQALADARRSCLLLAKSPTDDAIINDLHCGFHNIKGTAASLGLPEISAEGAHATELVAMLKSIDAVAIEDDRLAQIIESLDACLARLERLEVVLASAEAVTTTFPSRPAAISLAKTPAPSQRRVVFYCDDSQDCTELGAQLSCFGYSFNTFTDVMAMKAAILADPPDAVILSTSGTEVMADLRRSVAVPTLFLSQRTDFESRLKAVQAGSQAYFLKPASAHDIIDVLDRVTVHQEPEPFRVLIVDDEPQAADYHAAILEAAGMMVRRLDRPDGILQELAEFAPDLLLMDIYMPTCSGHDLSRLIRQIPQFVSLPIIFLSSETDKTVQVSAMRLGADGFLTKPIIPDDLVNAVVIRAERTRVLHSLMMRDSLTGLLNHTTLFQFLDTSLANARRKGGQLCFVMLDVDHFKTVNDIYGHPAGDQVLVALARMLKQRLRLSDMIGRYGGEEFALVLPDVSVNEAAKIVDRIRQDFAALIFEAGTMEFSCSFSGGVAGFPDAAAADLLIKTADQALYSAKVDGRNRIHVAILPAAGEDRR